MPSLLTLVLKALPLVSVVLADHPVYSGSNSGYQDKSYGLYPNQSYQSTNISSPIFQVNTEAGDNVSNASYVFISPRGTVVGQISPMIINSTDLSLVWAAPE